MKEVAPHYRLLEALRGVVVVSLQGGWPEAAQTGGRDQGERQAEFCYLVTCQRGPLP